MQYQKALLRGLSLLLIAASARACTPLADLEKRMPEWVGTVPYSHIVNKSWGYPTDCSGFVSWALQAQVGHFLKAYEYGSSAFASRIPTDELRYGDIVTHVWAPIWGKGRCVKKSGVQSEEDVRHQVELRSGGNPFDYLPGHVYFFDRWVNATTKTEFWAYESTSTEDQTPECKSKGPAFCFNHHVVKKRKQVDHWSSDNCTSSQYGYVTGGAHRLSSKLLCPP